MAASRTRPGRPLRAAVLAIVLAGVAGCRSHPAPPPAVGAHTPDVARLWVLMLNGGATPQQNFQSHLLHLQRLDGLLTAAGVAPDHVAIHSSDGADPAADVALREREDEPGFWLLEGTRLEGPLRTPITYVSAAVPGATLAPASKEALRTWFQTTGRALRPGDTLLLYVTDHGSKNPKDPLDNAITLWGPGQSLTVRELADLLRTLRPGVRVVALMSQCFSGAFAALPTLRGHDGLPDGSTCGFFSSTADRPAYGCYPENRGKANVGHSVQFLDALARDGDFPDAHRAVLEHDDTPDVPLRTSDVWLEGQLRDAAQAAGQPLDAYADALLRDAWRDQGAWEADVRLLDRIGHAFGSFSPRSLAELGEQTTRLTAAAQQLKQNHRAWEAALDSARRANLDRFVAAHPAWRERLADAALRALSPAQARALTHELLADLARATAADASTHRRLATLKRKAADSGAVSYRMEVRLGVLLRMRSVLLSVAGRQWLATGARDDQRRAYDELRACEDLALPPTPVPPDAVVAQAAPFPPLADDLAAAEKVLPAWMGIQFTQASDAVRTAEHLEPGAASVLAVYPDSPAQAAGLQAGDVVVGPPGAPFRERDQIREWTMLSRVDEPRTLDVLRAGTPLQVTLAPKPMPRQWPKLPGPPKPGATAPPLELGAYRGTPPVTLADGKERLLFFWATWCAICKSSLPELDAFARERGVPVIAITDETRDRLDPFFAHWTGPFPAIVATDEARKAFISYGVSGLPTFVLVKGDGTVAAVATGYDATKGLAIDGWTWSARPSRPAPHG